VSFEPGVPLDIDRLLDMKEELETRFGRPVDLVEREAMRNPWRKREILKTHQVLYAAWRLSERRPGTLRRRHAQVFPISPGGL